MNVPVQLSDRGTEASAPERQTLLALDSVDAKSIAKKKEQEKPKGFTVWVGGFPDNCVDDHKLFHREMERVGALARRPRLRRAYGHHRPPRCAAVARAWTAARRCC